MSTASARPRFSSTGPFQLALKQRVDAYFQQSGLPREGNGSLRLKTAVMFLWLAGSYSAAMWGGLPAPLLVGTMISLGLAAAGIGFCVMHDANHGSYAKDARWNRLLGLSSDLIGVSSFVWRQKHNVLHHTYTNIAGFDDDLDSGGLLRLAPWQERRPFHRLQHLYVWVLYAVFPLRWWLIDDFRDVARGRIGPQPIPRPRGLGWVELFAGKLFFFGWAFVLPAVVHQTWWVLPLTLLAVATTGIALAVVFQLAHCTGEAQFLDNTEPGTDFAAHQVRTTVDFAQRNRLLSWYVGGLNFQIEHHLFPKISHVHYPALAEIVRETCREFELPYHASETLRGALAENVRWLVQLGRPAQATRSSRMRSRRRVTEQGARAVRSHAQEPFSDTRSA